MSVNFRGKTVRKVFAGLISSLFQHACMHACDIKFVGIKVCGTCLIGENHKNVIPSKYTRYTVVYDVSVQEPTRGRY